MIFDIFSQLIGAFSKKYRIFAPSLKESQYGRENHRTTFREGSPGKILQLRESGVYRYVWAAQNRQDIPDSTILQESVFF